MNSVSRIVMVDSQSDITLKRCGNNLVLFFPRIPKGVRGANGRDAMQGDDGKDGKDGKEGVNGKDGDDGKEGVDGKNGKDNTEQGLPGARAASYPIGTDRVQTSTPNSMFPLSPTQMIWTSGVNRPSYSSVINFDASATSRTTTVPGNSTSSNLFEASDKLSCSKHVRSLRITVMLQFSGNSSAATGNWKTILYVANSTTFNEVAYSWGSSCPNFMNTRGVSVTEWGNIRAGQQFFFMVEKVTSSVQIFNANSYCVVEYDN